MGAELYQIPPEYVAINGKNFDTVRARDADSPDPGIAVFGAVASTQPSQVEFTGFRQGVNSRISCVLRM